jgi:hypothetical protein
VPKSYKLNTFKPSSQDNCETLTNTIPRHSWHPTTKKAGFDIFDAKIAVNEVAPEKTLSGFLQMEPATHHSTIAA